MMHQDSLRNNVTVVTQSSFWDVGNTQVLPSIFSPNDKDASKRKIFKKKKVEYRGTELLQSEGLPAEYMCSLGGMS